MKSLRKIVFSLTCMLVMAPLIAGLASVSAYTGSDLRVLPSMVIRFQTPVYFSVQTVGDDPLAYNPMIFLVMTKDSYDALTGVEVSWAGDSAIFTKLSFHEENDGSVQLPPEASSETQYLVSSLREKLGTSGPIYWTTGPFLGDVITPSPKEFIVTVHSSKPNMLVYVYGKSSGSVTNYDMRSVILESKAPSFHVPEPATILGIGASITALLGYSAKKRKWL